MKKAVDLGSNYNGRCVQDLLCDRAMVGQKD